MADAVTRPRGSPLEVLLVFLRLGLTSFGGPIAHLGYFRDAVVVRRRWLDEAAYADLVALCQFLPGPASSQAGMAIGLHRAGLAGALCAWLGFTLPSAAAMILFAYGTGWVGVGGAWLHGLKVVAVAVVAQAVWGMARSLCPDRGRASVAVGAALLALLVPTAFGQVGAILVGGLVGWWLLPAGATGTAGVPLAGDVGRPVAVACLVLFVLLLAGLPLLAAATGSPSLLLFDSFYRTGSLVFGGGHVVLPLLQAELVPPGWVAPDRFLAGYGAAQAVPGPLFTFAAYLGAAAGIGPGGWRGGLLCLGAIFLPSFLLVVGVLPFWEGLRRRGAVQSALRGVNAAVVGLLLAALYTPVWTSAVLAPADFALALVAFLALALWAVPPWLVVLLGAVAAEGLARF
ncbi:chromate transporter [Inquilinus ginsengisoli]|uniref:Chromate transporter n=1 Tax=Inquilinus ginsengisoli TaxID=363840 RepID=A0ABU1JZ78_9PROT|nr:chromate efflux transporter [Inquilinus ginsengisoli]MDR6293927.1 chromate transporter [Inquilinus ginsengisoli]